MFYLDLCLRTQTVINVKFICLKFVLDPQGQQNTSDF